MVWVVLTANKAQKSGRDATPARNLRVVFLPATVKDTETVIVLAKLVPERVTSRGLKARVSTRLR